MEALVVKADGRKLRNLRKLALMTQQDLVEASGVSRDTIHRIENGHDAHPSTLKKLAIALGVEGRDLLTED
jgi:transcriptional regulator with XRE-family HTH domain